jgi:hypothetical protein
MDDALNTRPASDMAAPESALSALSSRLSDPLLLTSDVDAPSARRFAVTYDDGTLVCEGTTAEDAVEQAEELLS